MEGKPKKPNVVPGHTPVTAKRGRPSSPGTAAARLLAALDPHRWTAAALASGSGVSVSTAKRVLAELRKEQPGEPVQLVIDCGEYSVSGFMSLLVLEAQKCVAA